MNTLVLHHGLYGFNVRQLGLLRVHYWNGIEEALAHAGYQVLSTDVHPTAGTARRAQQLKERLEQQRGSSDGNQRFVIIAHSMGGLDARYMISRLGMAKQVAALITIGTGHHGSSWFDWLIRTADCFGQLTAIQKRFVDLQGVWDCTRARAEELSRALPDMPGVRYFSIAGESSVTDAPACLLPSFSVVSAEEGPNDGRVSIESATWGEFLGVWPLHHFHLINWPLDPAIAVRHNDVVSRYLELLDFLSGQGLIHASEDEAGGEVRGTHAA